MKRAVTLFLMIIFVVFSTVGVIASENDEITVMVNGEVFSFGEQKIIVKNGRILVPLQCGIFEKVSATTDYDQIYREIVIRTETHLLTLYIDKPVILNKGEKCYEPDVIPEYHNGLVYVPLRAFMEALGRTVEYNDKTNTAKIS